MIAMKAAESAQEESRLLNRPITILVGRIDHTCSYISRDVHDRLRRRLQCRISERFCGYDVAEV